MKAAQERISKYYKRKVCNEEPKFKVGAWVMINTKNIKTKRAIMKLNYKLCGKLQIEKLIGTCVYMLKLPSTAGKIHPVFHISLLEPCHSNPISRRRLPTPPSVDLQEQEWLVDQIVTSQIRKGQL